MTLQNTDSNQSRFDCSDRLSAQDRTLADRDITLSRRGFLGMTAGSILVAGMLNGGAKADSRNGIPYRTLGRTGERVSLIGLGAYHPGKQSDPNQSIRIIRSDCDGPTIRHNFASFHVCYNLPDSDSLMSGGDVQRLAGSQWPRPDREDYPCG